LLKAEICLSWRRLNTSLMRFGAGVRYVVSDATPRFNSFCQVKAESTLSPWENRLVTLACRESYQVEPSGGPREGGTPSHCGYGRSACFRGWLLGNPGYTLFGLASQGNRVITFGELMRVVN